VPILAVSGVERRQIHRVDRVDDEPRQVVLGQPLTQIRRHQQHLLAIARQEVLRHDEMVLTSPDSLDTKPWR
jgi:hypothetical protein